MGSSADSRSSSASGPAAGDVLDGRYRLVGRIGHGGFGDVWRADELLPSGAPFRQVALKLLAPGGDDAIDWAEEAKLLASFRHPSLVTIYAAGILDGSPPQRFVAMELLEGNNLADILRARGSIPWRRVLGWATRAAAALDLIHAAGVVHLDLKPANLFLCSDSGTMGPRSTGAASPGPAGPGHALKVLDFGIARRSGVDAVLPRRGERLVRGMSTREAELATGLFIADRAVSHDEEAFAATRPASSSGGRQVVIGTPGYMAPEVLELAEPTAAADAYALAVCVVQLATGHLPHAAPDEPSRWDDPGAVSLWLDEIRRATLRGALRAFDGGPTPLPRGLASLLRRLLAVDPALRGVVPGKLGALFDEAWERPHGVADPPYFGLAPFPPEGEGLLFARDDDIARLGRELEYEPCVVLQGVAGSGKSSLLAAGLVPYLGRHGVDGKDDWIAVPIAPSDDAPDVVLSRALAGIDSELEAASLDELAAYCEGSPLGVVLVIDPLDDLVLSTPRADDAHRASRARLEAMIVAIASGATRAGLRLVGAIGEDATAALLGSPVGAAVRAAMRFVGAPATAAIKDLVAAPAHYAGVPVIAADPVAADVRRELRAGGGRLPYVALALEDWWRARGPRHDGAASGPKPRPSEAGPAPRTARISQSAPASSPSAPASSIRVPASSARTQSAPTSAAPPSSNVVLHGDRWTESGGVGGAVVRHAERYFARLEGRERTVAEEILLRLSATDGTPLTWDEPELLETIDGAGQGNAETRRALDHLARAHLVRADGRTVEIGHAALLKEWRTLADARLANMERLVLLERLREARLAWERADNHKDFLLHGALAEDIAARQSFLERGIGPRDRAFLRESRRSARFQRAKRMALAGFVLAVLGGGALGKQMIDDAREQEAKAKAAAAELEQLAELAAKARRTEDPYERTTLVAATLERGSTDALLPLDLMAAAQNLVRADFLTLEHVDAPAFPWDDRYLVGNLSTRTLAILDFRPPEPDVIDDVDLDLDPEQADAAHFKKPSLTKLRPHDVSVVERVPFAFDTSFATRSGTGEVKVFRLRGDGKPVLAAIAPMRCTGAMQIASSAPVLACATDRGVARWDLREARRAPSSAVDVIDAAGEVADVSSDGERVAVVSGHEVRFWSPRTRSVDLHVVDRPVSLVRFAPRAAAAAIIDPRHIQIVDEHRPGRPLFTLDVRGARPERARWDDGGLDLALCSGDEGRWYYLRRGGRAKDDPEPAGDPCAATRSKGQPEPVRSAEDFHEIAERDMGAHLPLGGWKLRHRRFLSRDLVVLDAGAGRSPAALSIDPTPAVVSSLLRFTGRDDIGSDEPIADNDSIAAVERDEGVAMFQIGDEMRFYTLPEGTRLFTRKGNFLRRCADGRWLAWTADGAMYRIFEAIGGVPLGSIPRDPGFVLGASATCAALYTQRIDGTIVASSIAGGSAPREIGRADGYVYDVRPSAPRPIGRTEAADASASGLLLAVSSGAIARIDDATGTLRVLGYASPRASALADGPRPGEVVVADGTGVVLLQPGAPPSYLRDGAGVTEWTDLSVSPDATSMLLASPERVASLDLVRRDFLGSMPIHGHERIARWDDEGSVLLWSFDRVGGAEGVIVPRGVTLAKRVAHVVSNLDVENGRVSIRR